jgi:hypothetical protein
MNNYSITLLQLLLGKPYFHLGPPRFCQMIYSPLNCFNFDFSKVEVVFSSIIKFFIIFTSIILIALFFAVIGSQVTIGIGLTTLILIMITNFKYLSPKVYPLIRNQ